MARETGGGIEGRRCALDLWQPRFAVVLALAWGAPRSCAAGLCHGVIQGEPLVYSTCLTYVFFNRGD